MVSGHQTLGSIDRALHDVRGEVRELDRQIQAVSDHSVRLRQEAATQYQRLAENRLDELAGGVIFGELNEAERSVNDLLDQRRRKLESQEQEMDESQSRQQDLEAERDAQQKVVAKAARALDHAEAETQERLKTDASYLAQLQQAQQADGIAKQAEQKTRQAETDRQEKGEPYRADPLFMYLWDRHFGTSEYEAGNIARFLDKWVARLCDYHNARPNYAMLNEIPNRLTEHSKRLREHADKEYAALEELEEAAAVSDGIPILRDALDQAKVKNTTIDDAIQEEENLFHQLASERSIFAAGEDDYSRRGTDILLSQMRRESMTQLRRRAETTVGTEDDFLVQRLIEIEDEQDELDDELRHHKRVHQRHLERQRELEGIRRKFKQRDFDGTHSTFANGALLGSLLTEFLRGMASSDELWKTIERHQRTERVESNPTFGSGGFGRSQGGVWKTPVPGRPSTSHIPPVRRSPPPRGSSGGGFRTGGGF